MDHEEKDTPPVVKPQALTHTQIVDGVKRVLASKFKYSDLMEMKSYINGLLSVASKEKK